MKLTDTILINKKAETKKDGAYSFRGFLYAVKSKKFVMWVNSRGEVFQRYGSFNTIIGNLDVTEKYNWRKKIIKLLEKL